MTQYNTLNVKLSNYQLKKLKSEIKYGTEITSKVGSSIAHDSNDDSNQERNCIKQNNQEDFQADFRTITKALIAFNRKCT